MRLRPQIGPGLFGGVENRDDAGVVRHFHRDDDIVVGLHELVAAVVQGTHHAGSGGVAEADQAAFRYGNRFRSAGVADAGQIAITVVVLAQIDQGNFESWNATAGRIDDQGSAEFALDIGQRRAGIHPEQVVAAQTEILSPCRRRSGFRIDGRAGLDVLRGNAGDSHFGNDPARFLGGDDEPVDTLRP